MKKLTGEWLAKAEADLAVVAKIAKGKPVLRDAVCFHCQQAAEKLLKALLQEHGQTAPRTHDLPQLVQLLSRYEPKVKSLRRGLAGLSRAAVIFRYPGHEATARQARVAMRQAARVREIVRRLLVGAARRKRLRKP